MLKEGSSGTELAWMPYQAQEEGFRNSRAFLPHPQVLPRTPCTTQGTQECRLVAGRFRTWRPTHGGGSIAGPVPAVSTDFPNASALAVPVPPRTPGDGLDAFYAVDEVFS